MATHRREVLVLQYHTEMCDRLFEEKLYKRLGEKAGVPIRILSAWDTYAEWNDPESLLENIGFVVLGGSRHLFHEPNAMNDFYNELFRSARTNTKDLIDHLLNTDFPTLGVCFGHQIIANTLGVVVHANPHEAKVGTHAVTRTRESAEDRFFNALPDSFDAQYGHEDSLSSMPYAAVLLARGKSCQYSAFRHKNNVYGVQFHPELTQEDLIEKAKAGNSYLPQNVEDTDLLRPSPHASALLSAMLSHYTRVRTPAEITVL